MTSSCRSDAVRRSLTMTPRTNSPETVDSVDVGTRSGPGWLGWFAFFARALKTEDEFSATSRG